MSDNTLNLAWVPPGPVSARFVVSRDDISIINGPVGSGKTTTCFQKAITLAAEQRPSKGAFIRLKGDGIVRPVRRFKVTVVRLDYRQLWRSTIPSWNHRYPQSWGKWTGARNAPAMHELMITLDDGSAIEFIIEFVAIGDNDIEDFMRGYEPTMFYLNELDLLSREVMQHALLRAGRYPPMDEGGPTWSGIIADCNAPVVDSWLYNEIFNGVRPADEEADGFDLSAIKLFRQPGAFDPGAENLGNLLPGYYERQKRLISDKYLIRRMVENQPAPSRSGKPVHEEFNDFLHVAPGDIAAIAGLPLILGFDAGLDPAMVVYQKLGTGRWNCLDELVAAHGTGPIQFSTMVNELLAERYPNWHAAPVELDPIRGWRGMQLIERPSNIRAWCDPSATYGGSPGSEAEAEQTWCDLVSYHTGIRIRPAPTNNTTDRRAAMKRVLTLMPDGKPAFQLSPRCKMVRAGLAGQFRYRKMQLAREERYTDEVDKNAHSHPCEAAEYPLLADGEMAEVHERRQRGWDARNLPRQAEG